MSAQQADGKRRKYDRAFLLSERKRNLVMALWEIQKYGLDSLIASGCWRKSACLFGPKSRSNHKQFLVRRMAWRLTFNSAPSLDDFVAKNIDACAMTNMEALDMPAVAGVDTATVLIGDNSDGNAVMVRRNLTLAQIPGKQVWTRSTRLCTAGAAPDRQQPKSWRARGDHGRLKMAPREH